MENDRHIIYSGVAYTAVPGPWFLLFSTLSVIPGLESDNKTWARGIFMPRQLSWLLPTPPRKTSAPFYTSWSCCCTGHIRIINSSQWSVATRHSVELTALTFDVCYKYDTGGKVSNCATLALSHRMQRQVFFASLEVRAIPSHSADKHIVFAEASVNQSEYLFHPYSHNSCSQVLAGQKDTDVSICLN